MRLYCRKHINKNDVYSTDTYFAFVFFTIGLSVCCLQCQHSSSRWPAETFQVIHGTSETRGVPTDGFTNEVGPLSYLKEKQNIYLENHSRYWERLRVGWSGFWNPGKAKYFSLLLHAHPDSYFMGTDLSTGDKATETWSWLLISIYSRGYEWVEPYLHSYMSSRRGPGQLYLYRLLFVLSKHYISNRDHEGKIIKR